jgi:2-dehydropantoate 2-reductase
VSPTGASPKRVIALARALVAAGFKCPVKADIRTDIWVKLWGNVAFNPISALTGATLKGICDDPATRAVARSIMNEAEKVAAKLGVTMPIGVERRIDAAGSVGEHKTSMLQDMEARKPLELDALLGAVIEIAGMHNVPVPSLRALYGLTKLAEEVRRSPD